LPVNRILSLLGLARRAGIAVLGFAPTCAAVEKGRIRLVIMAGDTAANTRKKVERICRRHNVPFSYLASREELGRAVGKQAQVVLGLPAHGLTGLIMTELSGVAQDTPGEDDKE
jgi:ribosomal protein L7Ae-like RNA K-turn-binding protein